MRYKEVVAEIRGLNWKSLQEPQLERLMQISHGAAEEFAEALRIGLQVYKSDDNLQQMARGELKANNLKHGDYDKRGDHSEFLAHFLEREGSQLSPEVQDAIQKYRVICSNLTPEVRAKTVFSREEELSGIFAAILCNEHWSTETLQAFRYYLQKHIELDSEDGGHADLVSAYEIDDVVLPFYEARLDLYRVIPELFKVNSERQKSV